MKDLEVTFDIEEGKDLDCVFKIDALLMNYDDLGNKPQINGITLEGNKTSADLELASEQDVIDLQEKVAENEKRFDDYRTASEQDVIDNELKNTDTFLQNQITENKENIDKVERELSYEADEREKADEALQEQITANASNFNNYRTASEQDIIDNGIKTDISNVQASVSDVQALIPNQASKDNQLADKNFVNSSLSTETANFLGTYDTLEELEAVPNPTNNDYGFVKSIDDVGNTVYSRYKYNATNAEWLFEYALNNSSFTAEQWTAINSGITNELVGQITTNKNDIATKQDIITDLTTIREGASKGATAVQPNQLHDGKLTIKTNGQEVATFTANQATNVEADISIPDSATWGNITGTLSNQTDLQNALNTKQNKVTAGDNITINNNVISVSDTLSNQVTTNTEKIKEIELFKFPNAVIIGEPVINNGQVSSFSTANYMQFPFIVDVKNKPFTIDFGFTTGANVTTQQNIIDSNYGMALAIQNGKALMAISSNGTSWDIGVISGTKTIQTNSTYLARITWDGAIYKGYLSTDGGATYQEDMSLTSSLAPYPRTIYIGGGTTELLGHSVNPFLGIIDMNKAYLTVQGLVIWQGMDDAGLATRADVSLSNLNEQGLEVIRKNSSVPTNYVTTDTAQNITGAKNFINSATSTTPDAHTSMSITLKNDQAELGVDSTNSDGTVNFKYQGVRFVDKNNEEVASLYSAPDGIGGSFTRLNASAKVDGEYVDGFVELEVDANGKTHFYVPEVDEDSTVNGTQAATVDYVKDQVSTKQDTISDLSTIRSNAAKGATSVQLSGNQTIAGTKTFSSTLVITSTALNINNSNDVSIQKQGTIFVRKASGGQLILSGTNGSIYLRTKGDANTTNQVEIKTDGTVNATKFIGALQGNVTGNVSGSSGSCTGNAATATKATQDGSGNNIINTYATKTELNAKANTSLSNITDAGKQVIKDNSGSWTPALLQPFWFDHIINRTDMLRADTFSWQSGTTYSSVYNYLVAQYNNSASTEATEDGVTYKRTPDGLKIALAVQETAITTLYESTGVAWYYILDSTNTRFKLPRTQYSFNGYRDGVGNYIPESLPNIKGSFGSGGSNYGSVVYNYTGAFVQNNKGGGTSVNAAASGQNHGADFDASVYSDTYKDNAPVQERSTQMYLYFYVGEYTPTAVEQTAGLNTELFNNKADLDLNNTTVPHITETYVNGTSWYRVYSDGWCEQGGMVTVTGETANSQVTFVKSYTTVLSVVTTIKSDSAYSSNTGSGNLNSINMRAGGINRVSTTGFYFNYLNKSATSGTGPAQWVARGYIS